MGRRKKSQQALVAGATTFLEELDAGEIDDAPDALQAIDEYLEAIDAEHAEVRAALAAARAALDGSKRGRSRPGAAKRAAAKPAPANPAPAKPRSRKVPPGTKLETDADRIGGTPPFELTYADSGKVRRISTLRAHMRFFFRVPKRDMLDDLRAIYDELLAAFGPFAWLQQTTTQLYSAANAPAIARARLRFECPARSSCYIGLKAAELADDVAERRLDVQLHPRGSIAFTGTPSTIHLTLPPGALDDALRDRFVDLCARLPSLACATAGYLLDATFVRPAAAKRIMDAALAHPGLELPGAPSASLEPGWICGVNWLTALGPETRAVLGAPPRGADLALHTAGDTLVIQAGRRPDRGAGGIPPPAYARVHAYLDRPSTMVGLPTTLADPRVNAWHARLAATPA